MSKSKSKSKSKSESLSKKWGNTEPLKMMKDEKDEFYVVRKGDVVATNCYRSRSAMDSLRKRSLEVLAADTNEVVGSMPSSTDPARKHYKVDPNLDAQEASNSRSCTLNFDGASKGNPGQAGAGAVLRADDGSLVYAIYFITVSVHTSYI
ncbi:hypothetical protein RJ641_002902 [Dillenia turbinata]|uniref:RNase H type-1 domain-containing protein n=1 Tax=Dillenia turbinata TaxID=194707 RepID=A0AAN8Z8Y8_9MAGN